MANNRFEKQQKGEGGYDSVAEGRVRKAREDNWFTFLDLVHNKYFAYRGEGKTFSAEEVGAIRAKARGLLAQEEFSNMRNKMLKSAAVASEIGEADWVLLETVFGEDTAFGENEEESHLIERARDIRGLLEITRTVVSTRAKTTLHDTAFSAHRAFNKKRATLIEAAARDPKMADRLRDAESSDARVLRYLWQTPNPKVWDALIAMHLPEEAVKERAFEKNFSRNKEATSAELARLRNEMKSLWSTVAGPDHEASPLAFEDALPAVQKILALHDEAHNVEKDSAEAAADPEYRVEELERKYQAGDIDADAFVAGLTEASEAMDQEQKKQMGRVAMREARFARDAAGTELDPEARRKFWLKAGLYERHARTLLQ